MTVDHGQRDDRVDVPVRIDVADRTPRWGSDVFMRVLADLGVEYVTVMPGSTTRGMHDSAVNFTGNTRPELILCNHEMLTASIARGYARVTDRPMAALLHNVVGLLNTAMTIYDTWVDRVPVLVIGGTGPVDSTRRRPGIDWRHTANVQGNAVRDYTKWDDQPASVEAGVESLLRAYRIAMNEPKGPTYVCLDVELQEQPVTADTQLPDVSRYRPATRMGADPAAIDEAARRLIGAELPVAIADRVGRHPEAVDALVELADLLAMPVVDMGERCNFPTPHVLNFSGMGRQVVADADAVIGLDAPNLFGAMRGATNYRTRSTEALAKPGQTVTSISVDELSHRGWQTDYQALPAVDLPIMADTELAIPALLEACRRLMDGGARAAVDQRRRALSSRQDEVRSRKRRYVSEQLQRAEITEARLVSDLWDEIRSEDFVVTTGRLEAMAPGVFKISGPRQYVAGGSGGGAVGASPGVALGASLALKGSGSIPVAVIGDGSLFASIQALWTAAHYRIPSLWLINNNRSYFNDEDHQYKMAQFRDRPTENAWISQRLEDPEVDYAAIARDLGLHGEGPIKKASDLRPAIRRAIEAVQAGKLALVDVQTANRAFR